MTRKLFETMSPAARSFYSRVFNRAIINAWAVKHGYFDTLLCETEDPTIILRWQAALPAITAEIMKRKLSGR